MLPPVPIPRLHLLLLGLQCSLLRVNSNKTLGSPHSVTSKKCTMFTYVFRVTTNYIMFSGTDDPVYLQVKNSKGSFRASTDSDMDIPRVWSPEYIELDTPYRDNNEYDRTDRYGPFKWCGESLSPNELIVWKEPGTSDGWNVLKIQMEIHVEGQPTNRLHTFWGHLWLDNEMTSRMTATLGQSQNMSRYTDGGGRLGLSWWLLMGAVAVVGLMS